MPTTTVIGLGNMGGSMAANLVKAGHQVIGVDPSPQAAAEAESAGVTIAAGVAEAVADADVVITMLPNGGVVEKVLTGDDGVFAHLPAGALVADCSTIDVPTAQRMHEAAAQSGHRYVDAPVSGGVTGAEQATLTFMVGGEAAAVDQARPMLEAMGKRVVHAGGPGMGAAAKIANNMLLGISLAGVCEAFVLAERLGLDPKTFYDIASTSSGNCWALRTWTPVPGIVEGTPSSNNWKPGFATTLMIKDMRLATGAGDDTSTQLDMASTAAGIFERFAGEGNGDLDCSAIIELIRGKV